MHRGVDHELVDRIGEPANGALRQRDPGEQPLGAFAEAHVDLGHHPDRRALVDGQVGDPLGQLGDELDGGGAGADDGDPAALERILVVPRGGVDDLAREVRRRRGCRAPCGWDRKPVAVIRNRAVSVSPSASATRQTLGVLVPAGALDDGVEPHVPAHVVLVGDVVGVLLDLRARWRTAATSSGSARRSRSTSWSGCRRPGRGSG